ncbi:MAG: hypothetical protein LBJ21_03570, partial [Acidobacteriota bacterium]|nr:hypothetical protein [Acidobacteriota bacterium]
MAGDQNVNRNDLLGNAVYADGLRAQQEPKQMGLTNIMLDFGNGATPFALREHGSDKGVLQQIFFQKDYDLTRLARFGDICTEYQRIAVSERTPLIIDCGANIGA